MIRSGYAGVRGTAHRRSRLDRSPEWLPQSRTRDPATRVGFGPWGSPWVHVPAQCVSRTRPSHRPKRLAGNACGWRLVRTDDAPARAGGEPWTHESARLPMDRTTVEERLDRLESIEAIRQLAGRYSLSLDMRDLDAHVNLFAPDIQVGRGMTGRAHLKQWLDDTLRLQFTGTSHHLGQHLIEFIDADNAVGVVYSKNEH